MNDVVFEIKENARIAKSVYKMTLCGDTSDIKRPGQFVSVMLDGFYLRRPLSVCDREGDTLTLIYKSVGHGTDAMSRMTEGQSLSVLCGLGNGYDTDVSGGRPLLIGGGAGVPPLYLLAKELAGAGKEVSAVLGFNSADEVFYEEEFKALGCDVTVTTADGSYGRKGFVTDALPDGYTYYYTCGPLPMLKAVYKACKADGQFSFEERMGCGFGACMGCSHKTVNGYKRVCRDGPVFYKEEILWED